MATTVINIHHWTRENANDIYVYCGRRGPYGNQFIIGRDGTREEVIAKHRAWLWLPEQTLFRAECIRWLTNRKLGCYCAPLPCHCDNYVDLCDGRNFGPGFDPTKYQIRDADGVWRTI